MNIIKHISTTPNNTMITEAGKPSVVKLVDRSVSSSGRHAYNSQFSSFEKFFNLGYIETNTKHKFRYKGTIQDKDGNSYDVSCRVDNISNNPWPQQFHCVLDIFEVVNGEDATFESDCKFYDAKKHDLTMLSDLQEGIYLEDFFAKHFDSLSNEDKSLFDEIISKGDKSAESFYKKERARESSARDKFWESKIKIRDFFGWEVFPGGQLKVTMQSYNDKNPWVGKAEEIVTGYVKKQLETEFQVKLSNLDGLVGTGKIQVKGIASYDAELYIDTSKDIIINIDSAHSKITGKEIVIALGQEVTLKPSGAAKFAIALFMKACEKFVNGLKGQKGKWVEAHYMEYRSYKDPYSYYGRWKDRNVDDCRKMAGQEFERMKNAHTWDGEKTIMLNKDDFKELIPVVAEGFNNAPTITKPEEVKAAEKPEVQEKPTTSTNTEPKRNLVQQGLRGTTTSVSSKEARVKMQAWHDGTRGFNVTACGDAKLKVNYAACKELGFDKEAGIIKAEADSRGLVLEHKSLYESLLIYLS